MAKCFVTKYALSNKTFLLWESELEGRYKEEFIKKLQNLKVGERLKVDNFLDIERAEDD